jgi:putative transposase
MFVPSYKPHRFPPEVIAHAVWLYYRFALSLRDIEEMLASRGVTVSYEAIRLWCGKFGPEYAKKLRQHRRRVGGRWHVDEVFIRINGSVHYRGEQSIKTGRLWTSWYRHDAIARPRNGSFIIC